MGVPVFLGEINMEQRFFYCPICGGGLIKSFLNGRQRLVCSKCGRIHYENPIVGVAAIIRNSKGEILMAKRAPGLAYAGFWCIPCGYVEYDEDILAAVAREAQEETGLFIKPLEVYAVHSNFHDAKQHTVGIWFKTKIIAGKIFPGDDACELMWADINNPPLLAFKTDEYVLKQLIMDEI